MSLLRGFCRIAYQTVVDVYMCMNMYADVC